jgi:hypothetical protein
MPTPGNPVDIEGRLVKTAEPVATMGLGTTTELEGLAVALELVATTVGVNWRAASCGIPASYSSGKSRLTRAVIDWAGAKRAPGSFFNRESRVAIREMENAPTGSDPGICCLLELNLVEGIAVIYSREKRWISIDQSTDTGQEGVGETVHDAAGNRANDG